MEEELKYALALNMVDGVGSIIGRKLIKQFGSCKNVFEQTPKAFKGLKGAAKNVGKALENFNNWKRIDDEIKYIEENAIDYYVFGKTNYPERLNHCVDSPIVLFKKGNCNLNNQKFVGVVGTRNATNYGKEMSYNLIEQLSKHNITVVSGLAFGIDIAAHKAAVDLGVPTIAVLAHGLDRIYPADHKTTAKKMLEKGGLVTEFISKTNPDRENFPKRNRIIAGLCDAVIVVESKKKGGAIITAEIAHSYSRDVFAVPGKANDPLSEGCNYLIKSNKAAMVENAFDVEYLMGWETKSKKKKPAQTALFVELQPDEELIYNFLKEKGKTQIDLLCAEVNLPINKAVTALLTLELSGLVKSLPGKIYDFA